MEIPQDQETFLRRVTGEVDPQTIWPKWKPERPWQYLGAREDPDRPGVFEHYWARPFETHVFG